MSPRRRLCCRVRNILARMNDAFAAGHSLGALRKGTAIDCPIDHSQIMVRLSWMDGFSKGRCVLAKAGDGSEVPIWQ